MFVTHTVTELFFRWVVCNMGLVGICFKIPMKNPFSLFIQTSFVMRLIVGTYFLIMNLLQGVAIHRHAMFKLNISECIQWIKCCNIANENSSYDNLSHIKWLFAKCDYFTAILLFRHCFKLWIGILDIFAVVALTDWNHWYGRNGWFLSTSENQNIVENIAK